MRATQQFVRQGWLISILLIAGLYWAADSLAADTSLVTRPSTAGIVTPSVNINSDATRSPPSGSEVRGEIEGHLLKTGVELKALSSKRGVSDLASERRWASDVGRTLTERRIELRDELQQHPSPLEMEPLKSDEYVQRYTIIQSQIHQAQQDDSDNSLDQHRRAEARARQLELTREEAQLQLKQVESERYTQQRNAFSRATIQYGVADNNLRAINHYLSEVDDAIAAALAETSSLDSFRLWMGLTYGALVAALIGGFYSLALKTSNIRDALFRDDKGLQFIAVFSIIIAIILLGIMNVLEGKELSALLGGLSGYILGRSNFGDRRSDGNAGRGTNGGV